jgi:hypothetical protein
MALHGIFPDVFFGYDLARTQAAVEMLDGSLASPGEVVSAGNSPPRPACMPCMQWRQDARTVAKRQHQMKKIPRMRQKPNK